MLPFREKEIRHSSALALTLAYSIQPPTEDPRKPDVSSPLMTPLDIAAGRHGHRPSRARHNGSVTHQVRCNKAPQSWPNPSADELPIAGILKMSTLPRLLFRPIALHCCL
jgi:hypothetical protein